MDFVDQWIAWNIRAVPAESDLAAARKGARRCQEAARQAGFEVDLGDVEERILCALDELTGAEYDRQCTERG
jgi:hypothetical protein